MASMGPRSLNRGNRSLILTCGESLKRFNGAAVSQPRKLAPGIGVNGRALASMGPRSLNRGNTLWPSQEAKAKELLQWGRGLSTAETCPHGPRGTIEGHRFNGAAVSQPRKPSGRMVRRSGNRASMGPRSLNRGNCAVTCRREANTIALQWGRGLSTAETPLVLLRIV